MSEDLLRTHLVRSEPFASAYQRRVARIQQSYVPPYHPEVGGWDTRFMEKRAGQSYVPIPLVWFTVNVFASLMGMRPPSFQAEPKTSAENDRQDAANVELLLKYEHQRQTMREVHLDLSKVLSLKGRAGVKVGYEGKELWTENIDNIENLWPSFTTDSFRRVQSWTYHSLIDRTEAKEVWGWRDEEVGSVSGGFWQWAAQKFSNAYGSTKGDPFARSMWARTSSAGGADNPDFDGLPMIEFHHRNKDGFIVNEVWIGSQRLESKVLKMRDFPYITVNCETEPGNPFGIGDAEPVMSLQKEIATVKTMWHEAMRRNGQDTWIARGLRGLSPVDLEGGGRYFMVQGTPEEQNIEALKYPIDDVGYLQALGDLWDDYRRITGIPPEVLGGGNISAGTSGYAMAVKFQSVITRLGPRQTRMGTFYQTWARYTLQNMEIVEPESKDVIKDNYFVTIDWENITPKDFAQEVSSLATAVSAEIMSHRTAMEQLGLVSEDEFVYISERKSDAELSPETAAAIQAMKGQVAAAGEGDQNAIAGQQAALQNASSPSMANENQWTQDRTVPQQGAPNVVQVTPPSLG